MDTEKIIQELRRRFAAPLPEFYQRRIIFWYDEERSFEDQIGDLSLDGVKLLVLTGNNTFAAKKLLCEDDTISNYLVYDPRPYMKDDDNWLINVQLYSEEFRADLNSIWMDEMSLPATAVVRSQVKRYNKFFRLKKHREAVQKLKSDIATAAQMHLAVMAVLAGCSDRQPDQIIKSILCAGLDRDTNSIYQSFVTYGADKAFWVMVSQATGYQEGDDGHLGHLVTHILLTAATRTMHQDLLAGLDGMISTPHQAYCYDFVSDWLHSDDKAQLYELARYAEAEARLSQRFAGLTVEDLADTECFPCIDECILTALMKEIRNQIIPVDKIRYAAEKRRTTAWYGRVSCYYEGLVQVANMQAFYLEHSAGFHTVDPQTVWKEYTSDYYRMDQSYRQFHLCFQRSLKESNPDLDDLFKSVTEQVEGLYTHWFLDGLGQNWTTACAENLEQYGRILEIPQQEDFYNTRIRPADNRIYVIVSDAFRYEVAAALAEDLQREMQCKVSLSSCEGMFPTVTKFGMAALLPHKKLSAVLRENGTLAVLADGQPTDAGYRDGILKSANPNSVALKYDDLIVLKREERQALVRGMDVVYIYHDAVDKASHTSDSAVFTACDEAISQIKNMMKIIVNSFGGTNILVTADHGFIYTYSPLREDDKVDRTTPSHQDVEVDRRYLIVQKGVRPDYLLPVKFMDQASGFDAYAPRDYVRIKKKGGGLNFVHGGISLQEMVVPVLEFQYLRNSYKAYQRNRDKIDTKPVAISLLSANRKISNMIFSLNFYQKEAVGGNREAAQYLVYFVDANGEKISDVNKIIADKTSADGQERTFRCNFSLRSKQYSNRASYFLVIADESGLQPPVKEEFQIDIAFAVDDFQFF